MNRRAFIQTSAAAAVAPRRRPNLLFIMVDEWRAQSTGYRGDSNVITPALNRLAAESVRFDNAFSGCPVCCPARASLMTGQHPLRHGVFINDVELKPSGPTLAQSFLKAGYHTGYIGKWHLYGSPDGNYGRRLAFIPPGHRLGFDYWKACECSHEYNHSLYYEGDDAAPKYWSGYDAIAQTEDACRFLDRSAQSADPFFLFLSLGPPHFPLQTAPPEYQKLFADRELQYRPNVPEHLRPQAGNMLRGYFAHMAAIDDCLARLLASLDRNRNAEDTIVVFTSDHGDMMLSQALTTKLYPWDESIGVPFLLRYPRRFGRKGIKVSTFMEMPDIMPTLLSLAGLPLPGGLQGKDRSPLRPPTATSAAFLNLAVPITEARRYGIAEYRGLRTQRFTYVRSIHGPWLLYDNHADPYQMHNLAAVAAHRKTRRALDRALDVRLDELGDQFLPADEYTHRAGLSHYKEVNVPVGHVRSPWGDWESTLIAALP